MQRRVDDGKLMKENGMIEWYSSNDYGYLYLVLRYRILGSHRGNRICIGRILQGPGCILNGEFW